MKKNFWLSLIVLLSVVFNALPGAAQSGGLRADVKLSADEKPSEIFRGLYRAGDSTFARLLKKMSGGEAEASALEAQSVYFFEQFQAATKDQLSDVVEKARKAKEKRLEKPASKPGVKTKSAPKKANDIYGNGSNLFDERYFSDQNTSGFRFMNASYSPDISNNDTVNFAAEKPQITVTETDTGKTITAANTKTLDAQNVSGTQTTTGEKKVFYRDNTMNAESVTNDKTETVSKTDNSKITKTVKFSIGSSFDVCPDADGIVRGKGRTHIYNQTTTIKGKEIAALTHEYTVEFQITGYVNDAAEFTHFDMEGVAAEKILGYDRAVRVGMLDDAGGITDGAKSIVIKINRNTPPSETRTANGTPQSVSAKLGKVEAKLFGFETEAEVKRVSDVARYGLGGFMLELELLMRSSVSRWRHYECVTVECSSAKKSLKPNETAEVTAVSISETDGGKINADLKAVGTATVAPIEQKGTPTAIYTVTAPPKDKAFISVTSTSKRGIGLGNLEIPVGETKKNPPVKKPAPKPKDCDQGWTGTVNAVRVKRIDQRGNASGRLIRQIESVNENYSVHINVLGTRDTTGGIVTNFHGFAETGYLMTEYRESNYASGKMGCSGKIIESPETKKFELQTKGEVNGKIIVTISVIGNWGHISFTPPQLKAARISTNTYESNCPSYNAKNSGTEHSDYLIDIPQPMFEIEFETDPSKPNVIEGSKTVQESDGSETTYSWNLIRCQ